VGGLQMNKRGSFGFSAFVAIISCPCHLPIYLMLLSGTAAGVFLYEHQLLAILIFSFVFTLSVYLSIKIYRKIDASKISKARVPSSGHETKD